MGAQTKRARKRRIKVVVTAGPTREHLDDIRFLTNASTGRMGWAIAREAARRGADVVLVLGPSMLPESKTFRTHPVTSTQDLLVATREEAADADLVVFAAAPSDYRPARRRRGKPAREAGDLALVLKPTPDVARTLGRRKGGRIHVGFALEVTGGADRARHKLERKRFDAIVLNGPANLGGGGGDVHWIPRDGESEPLRFRSKTALARAIIARAWALLP